MEEETGGKWGTAKTNHIQKKTKYKTRETNDDDEEDAGGLITRRMQNPSKTQNLKQKLNQEK